MKILFLGTGTSTGVPVIGCDCETCRSEHPRNKRLRSSVLVQTQDTIILVDSCTDLRQQALRHELSSIDAVLYTHPHLDHVAGFDELRAFCWHRRDGLPLYAGPECMENLKRMYVWAFASSNTYQGYIRPEPHTHDGSTPFMIGDIEITPVLIEHASVQTHGYVFRHEGKSFGYAPDVKNIPKDSMPLLANLDAFAMDGLGADSHPSHLSVAENVELMRQLRPKQGLITHSGHRVEYVACSEILPDFMSIAYDGMLLEL